MDLSKFSPKDQQIIRNNPNVQPYDLMHDKGLSQNAYRKLIDMLNDEKDTKKPLPEEEGGVMQPDSVVPFEDKNRPHKPILTQPQQTVTDTKTVLKQGGIPQVMSTQLAMYLVSNYPNEFKIIDDIN
jgi:hypothetical protein